MGQLISSFPIGTIFYQSGYGYPTHIATRGCTYIDVNTAIEYINKDGIVDWVPFFDGSTVITGDYLPLSGGTVFGPTIFTSGLTANTLNVSGLTQTSGITSTGGVTFKQVTINSSYTATTSDYIIDVTGGTFNVTLPSAVGIQGRLLVVKNNGGGAVTVQPILGQNIDDKPFVILGETNTIQLASNGSNWIAISYNISTVNSSTGVFEFTGLSIASSTTFNVAPVKGWIVNDTTNPLSPQLYYVAYSGGVHTAIYVNTSTETWVYLTSGGTISQSSIELTEQQRRQNIFLGKLGHANKTNIINAFSQPDFVLSPLSQLRDMFTPINLINGGIYASPNGANLSFNTSAGYLYGLGINFATSTLNPNTLYVSGASPCTFQYRTQTGGTASNTTFIDPTKYDVGGVVTSITGTKATNQRIYLVQNGIFRVQYGQTEYNQLSAAIEGIATEQFNTFSNFTNNGILIGVLSVLSTATNLSDTTKARFFFTSKFGETVGAAGGVATTTLQQAYNNSSTPEIVTNSTLGALSIKNGTGNADNVTNLLEGINAAGNTTSVIKADGYISGTTIQTNGLTATTISATTYQNLPISINTSGTTLYSTNPSTSNFSNNNSVYLGLNAGRGATGATYSNFLGLNAGSGATSASYSNFFGADSGFGATGANSSNFLGLEAGYGATGASTSNFLGNRTGKGATTASQSNFFGLNAGSGATNASQSNFLGANAGYGATGANSSNFLGANAGSGATQANNSIFIGTSAGRGATGANNSIFLGYQAGYNLAGSPSYNNIIIGNNVSLNAGVINRINIGGVLFGSGTYSATSGNASVSAQTEGRIGINVVSPTHSLHVIGDTRLQGGLTATTISASSTINSGTLTTTTINGSNNQSGIVVVGSNTVGGSGYVDFIKVTNTSAGATNINKTIRVNNTGGLEIVNSAYSNIAFSLTDAGVLNTPGGGTSDLRTKKNIEYIYDEKTTLIKKLKPVKFEFKNNENIKRHGFIAQDILELYPELVLGNGNEENGVYGLDYDGILSLTVKALQESIIRIEKLESVIKELKNNNN
jgi:hypothetical protein